MPMKHANISKENGLFQQQLLNYQFVTSASLLIPSLTPLLSTSVNEFRISLWSLADYLIEAASSSILLFLDSQLLLSENIPVTTTTNEAHISGYVNLWETISEMAKDTRRNQLSENPSERKVPRKQSAWGGARPNSGRKKAFQK